MDVSFAVFNLVVSSVFRRCLFHAGPRGGSCRWRSWGIWTFKTTWSTGMIVSVPWTTCVILTFHTWTIIINVVPFWTFHAFCETFLPWYAMCSFRKCGVHRTTFIRWTWNTTSILITLVTIVACLTSCPWLHWLTFVTSLPDEGLMTLKDIRTWVLLRLITSIARVDAFDERTIQTVVIQIHSNDVMMLLWLNWWIIINVLRLDSLEKMSWGRDVREFEYRYCEWESEWDEER